MLKYLASPYTHVDPAIRDQRAREVCRVAARLIEQGHHVIAPIGFYHQIHLCGDLPAKWDFWHELDQKLIGVCGELWVVMLAGWATSVGVTAEIDIAKKLKIPVYLIHPETLAKVAL